MIICRQLHSQCVCVWYMVLYRMINRAHTSPLFISPRVARNMLNSAGSRRGRLSSSVTGEEMSIAKLLLENCVRLLRDSRHIDDINVRLTYPHTLAVEFNVFFAVLASLSYT